MQSARVGTRTEKASTQGAGVEDQVASIAAAMSSAVYAPSTWPDALEALAKATGGWGGQLLGVRAGTLLFDHSGGIAPEVISEFEASGGADPAVNPRVKAVLERRGLLSEPDFIDEADRRRHPYYADFLTKVEAPFFGGASAAIGRDALGLLATLRTAKQGLPDSEQRALFDALLPHTVAAMRLQVALEEQAEKLVIGAFEAVSKAAILCDERGVIAAVTPAAEACLAEGAFVAQRSGALSAPNPGDDALLQEAIRAAAGAAGPVGGHGLLIRGRDGAGFIGAQVSALPRRPGWFGVSARVLVLLTERASSVEPALVRGAGLTPAESAVVQLLRRGASPREVARLRAASLSTVRSQMKAAYAKLGVNRLGQLIALLPEF